MVKRIKCPDCGVLKFAFLIRKGLDKKRRCDACETDRVRVAVDVPISWEDVKAKRARILLATDWIETEGGQSRAGATLTAELLSYRQKLFDLTDDFAAPEAVIFPDPPKGLI